MMFVSNYPHNPQRQTIDDGLKSGANLVDEADKSGYGVKLLQQTLNVINKARQA